VHSRADLLAAGALFTHLFDKSLDLLPLLRAQLLHQSGVTAPAETRVLTFLPLPIAGFVFAASRIGIVTSPLGEESLTGRGDKNQADNRCQNFFPFHYTSSDVFD
jgi:hypothetical protein